MVPFLRFMNSGKGGTETESRISTKHSNIFQLGQRAIRAYGSFLIYLCIFETLGSIPIVPLAGHVSPPRPNLI